MSTPFKRFIFWSLVILFMGYTGVVHTVATSEDKGTAMLTEDAKKGKLVFQQYNCIACHQLYGLGGYMGPDLTNTGRKGDLYIKAFLQNGTQRMPNFHLTEQEMNELAAYLQYVDKTGTSPVTRFTINNDGTIEQEN